MYCSIRPPMEAERQGAIPPAVRKAILIRKEAERWKEVSLGRTFQRIGRMSRRAEMGKNQRGRCKSGLEFLKVEHYEISDKIGLTHFFLMIRIPFAASAEGKHPIEPSSRSGGAPTAEEEGRVNRVEARLAALELRLAGHAEELSAQVSERVLRIQSRLENALRPFVAPEPETLESWNSGKVVEFSGDSCDDHLIHARNACEALYELNQTLKLTREHLEALACSVDRMKRSVARK